MTEWPRYPKAPIVEALLDIRVSFLSLIEPARLASFQDAIRDRYPTKEPRIQKQLEIDLTADEGTRPMVKRGPEGFLFKSIDARRTVQVRQDGFTLNWLRPYDTWSAMRDEARPHWERYCAEYRPDRVVRLGLRYINRLELPLPVSDFRDFVRTAPDIAPDLPQGVSSLFMRLEIPDEKRGLVAIISETIQPPAGDGKLLPFIFDIDVVCASEFEPTSSDIWSAFERMRDYKNEIFDRSMTPRAKEMFQ